MRFVRRLASAALVLVSFSAAPMMALADSVVPPVGYPERVLGNPDAPVTIYEYSSLTCPHCASFHTDVLPRLKTDFIDTGKVRLVYRDFPVDQLAAAAALMVRCAPEANYFRLLEMLFRNQEQWSRAQNPAEALFGYARLAGMNQQAIDACFADQELFGRIVDVQTQANHLHGIESTPSFVINGVTHRGNIGYDAFARVLREAGAE